MQRPNLQRQNAFREPIFEIPRNTSASDAPEAPRVTRAPRGGLPEGYIDLTDSLENKSLRHPDETGAVGIAPGPHAEALINALFDYPSHRSPLDVLTGNDRQALWSLYTLMAHGVVDAVQICQQAAQQSGHATDRLPHALMRTGLAEGADLAERINELKAMGHDPDAPDSKGRSAASIAAAANRPDCLIALEASGVDISKPDRRGRTALHHAIKSGAFATCRFLLERHRENPLVINPAAGQTSNGHAVAHFINQTDLYGRSALHYLAALPQALIERAPLVQVRSVIDHLMRGGGDLRLADHAGRTPLHRLAKYGTHTHFASLNAHLGDDAQRFELFMKSAMQRNTAMVRSVFEAASQDQQHLMLQQLSLQDAQVCETALHTLRPDFSVRDSRGMSIAQRVCERIEQLAAQPNHQESIGLAVLGLSRLMKAGLTLSPEERNRITRIALSLESSGAPRGRLLGTLREAGALEGADTVIREYLTQVVGILAESEPGRHTASDIAFMLLKHLTTAGLPLPPNLQSEVIEHARRLNAVDFMDHLRRLGLLPSHTHLLEAISEQALDRVNAMIEAGVNLLERAETGLTALHHAILIGHQPVIDALIKAGGEALMNARDGEGKSPVAYAIRDSRFEALLALGKHGADLLHNEEPALKVLEGTPSARMKNCFYAAALGLGDVPVTLREATLAHRRMALANHPDKHMNSSPEQRRLMHAKTVLANIARDHFSQTLAR